MVVPKLAEAGTSLCCITETAGSGTIADRSRRSGIRRRIVDCLRASSPYSTKDAGERAMRKINGLAIVAVLAVPALSQASSFDAIYAFGDSLSDVGNIFTASGGVAPAAPYANGQFS